MKAEELFTLTLLGENYVKKKKIKLGVIFFPLQLSTPLIGIARGTEDCRKILLLLFFSYYRLEQLCKNWISWAVLFFVVIFVVCFIFLRCLILLICFVGGFWYWFVLFHSKLLSQDLNTTKSFQTGVVSSVMSLIPQMTMILSSKTSNNDSNWVCTGLEKSRDKEQHNTNHA